ncbi:MAG: Mur ligase family protein, partial [Methanobacteriota archaeon]
MAKGADDNPEFGDYDSAISYLYDLEFFGVKFGLENTRELLRRFGNPHLGYKTVHVTGTNGKGSVCAFVESALRAAGYKTGLYTSPHLVDFTERTRVNGEAIPREDVARLAGEVKRHVVEMAKGSENQQCTFFEATTALAFKHFAERKVDVAVIEVGMGGRLDSTNHIVPEVSVITSIGLEHTQYLGDTEAKIAYEKAG